MPSLNTWRHQSPSESNVRYMLAGEKLPGLKIGAAFFDSLRTNLNLSSSDTDTSPPPSPALRPALQTLFTSGQNASSTSPLLQLDGNITNLYDFSFPKLSQIRTTNRRKYSSSSTTTSVATLSPSSSISESDFECENRRPRPSLSHSISVAHTPTDRALAIHLLSTSILEQRRTTTYTLLTHPVNVICLLLATCMLTKACCYRRSWDDAPIVLLAIIMMWLSWGTFFRILAGWGYARHAWSVRESDWVGSDEVLVVKVPRDAGAATRGDTNRRRWWWLPSATAAAGMMARRQHCLDVDSLSYNLETMPAELHPDEPERELEAIIGVLILRHVPSTNNSKANRKCRNRGGQAWIRGWAISPTHRNLGHGTALLAAAARMSAARRGGDSIYFAADHAHSYTSPLLPHFWGTALARQRDRKAQMRLEAITGTVDVSDRRVGGGVCGSGGSGASGVGSGSGTRRGSHRRKGSGSGNGNGAGNARNRSSFGAGQGYGFGYAYAYGYERKVW